MAHKYDHFYHCLIGNAMATIKSKDPVKVMTVRGTAFEAAEVGGGCAEKEDSKPLYLYLMLPLHHFGLDILSTACQSIHRKYTFSLRMDQEINLKKPLKLNKPV